MVKVYIDKLSQEELLEANRELNKDIDAAIYYLAARTRLCEVIDIEDDTKGIRETENNKIIGLCNIYDYGYRTVSHSIYVYEEFRRQGYAKELLKRAIENNFNYTATNKIRIMLYSGNKASIKLHESLGFEIEATLKDYVKIGNAIQDGLYYVVSKNDYYTKAVSNLVNKKVK